MWRVGALRAVIAEEAEAGTDEDGKAEAERRLAADGLIVDVVEALLGEEGLDMLILEYLI